MSHYRETRDNVLIIKAAVIDLVACLRILSKEPHNDIRSQNTLCLCTAIETSLNNIGSDDGLADISNPLRSALHEFLDSISYLDRYGMFDYLRGILSVYGAMARRQARFLTLSGLAKLDACVAACTEGWPRGLAEAKILQERLAHLHGVLDTIPCVLLSILRLTPRSSIHRKTEGMTQDDARISICITAV